MHYDWSPISKRQPLKWPGGKRLALIVTVNCEYWDLLKDSSEPYYAGGPPMMPDPVPGNIADFPNFTWREYGQRVGVWRLFKVFEEAGVPLSCTFNAKMMLERPEILEHVRSRGWEVVAHNYEQGELLHKFAHDPAGERRIVLETLKVYEQKMGKKAKGWLSSSLRSTPRTPDIVAEQGCIFFCDYMNDDQPYLIRTDHGPIVSTPYSIEINDFTFFHRRAMTTREALQMLKDQFDELYAEGAESGRMMNIGIHPHVSGHPHRMLCYREFLKYAKAHEGTWLTTREEVAGWYLQHHGGHIS
ncbi:MAG: polysaccharide deacetylase [Betaproteobacteria bacterium]|nr:polysaccharide deacetylase [Betaproteobacteria bacterium]